MEKVTLKGERLLFQYSGRMETFFDMPLLSHTDLQVGMTVAQDVKDRQGRLLIPAGTSLNEKHLRAVKLWGIAVVNIESDGETGPAGVESAFSQEVLERAGAETEKIFANNAANREHPVYEPLFHYRLMKTARRMEAGDYEEEERPQPKRRGPKGLVDEIKDLCDYSLGNLVRKTKTVSSLPAIYQEITEIVNHPRSSAQDVANVISKDTGLTARLLKLVNSAFYGFPSKIETVSRAITMVGMNELCDLSLATSVTAIFGTELGKHLDMSMFWRHSICCGVVARSLAKQRREPRTERYFVAGLLHDIGRLVIFAQLPATAIRMVETSSKTGRPVHQVESETMKFNHADVGGALLEYWNLPASQREAVECHHQPGGALRYPVEAAVTHVAEVVTNAMRTDHTLVAPLVASVWGQLDLDPGLLPSLMEEAEMQVMDLARILEVDDM